LVGALAILVLSASSVRWFLREGEFVRADVSRTTVQPVFLTDDAARILAYLNNQPGRKVVLAMPGLPDKVLDENGHETDTYKSPYLPDLNPIAAGMTASYAYAGHWSETPDYVTRRTETTRFFLTDSNDEERRQLIQKIGATYIIAPVPETYNDFYDRTHHQLADVTGLGTVVVDGSQFRLIELR
jgi:arabinosyltransferase C